MKKSVKRSTVMALTISLLMPFLCSFSEGNGDYQDYLFRRNYEKILVESLTNCEISIAANMSTLHTPRGYVSSYYQNNELTQVFGVLDGLSSPINVQYHYDSEGELDRYYNGHLLLEKENEGYTTNYIVDGDRALSLTDKPESTTFVYADGTEVSESRAGDGAFEITRNSNWIYRGLDGLDGMLSCESYDGLEESWDYDYDGNLVSYEASDSTFYEKTKINSTTNDCFVRARGLQDEYIVTQNDCLVTYSGLHGNLISDFDIDSSVSSYGFNQSNTNWNIQFMPRADKPLEQIGIASSPYGTYRPSFNDSNLVTSIEKDGVTQRTYQYDGMNRLVSSTDSRGISYYVYDDANNMTKAICMSDEVIGDWFYSYSGGRLESVNGIPLYYDRNGNTVAYGRTNYQWDRGSILTKITSDELTVSFQYDAMNNPILRTTDSYDQKRLVWEGNRLIAESDGSRMLSYFYDCFGSPIGFTYNGGIYAYCKNAFQDVVGIVRDDGVLVAEYSYGDFGEPGRVIDSNGSGVAFLNPFRYRSYYFDQDLGVYYLRSRWYSPELRRFLSSDSPKALLQQASKSELLLNRYSYCANNPISYIDSEGTSITATIGGVAAASSSAGPAGWLLLAGFIIIVVAAWVIYESSNTTNGGTAPQPITSQSIHNDPIVSVVEPPAIDEPIVGGDAGVIEQPVPEEETNPFSDPDVQNGLRTLEAGLAMAKASAMLRIMNHYNHPKEWHHIVPRNRNDFFGLMPFVRAYMNIVFPGSGVNSMENQVHISTLLHKGLHNALCIQGVASALYPTTLLLSTRPFETLLKYMAGLIVAIDIMFQL